VESEQRLDEVMLNIQQRMGQPLLTDIRLALPGAFDLSPAAVDLYPGLPARLYGRSLDQLPPPLRWRGGTARAAPGIKTSPSARPPIPW